MRVFGWTLSACANGVIMPAWFGDDMVVQTSDEQGPKAKLNGKANSGEKVTVSGMVNAQVVADSDGEWVVEFEGGKSGSLGSISVKGEDGVEVNASNVQVGDVYVCMGQSNMEFPMNNSLGSEEEMQTMSQFPNFRFFVANEPSRFPEHPMFDLDPDGKCDFDRVFGLDLLVDDNFCNRWVKPSVSFVRYFSALCYMTARDIASMHSKQRPVGLIQITRGGTRLESWMSKEAIMNSELAHKVPVIHNSVNTASNVYNGMVAPFVHLATRGVIWAQGEWHITMHDAYFPHMNSPDSIAYYAGLYSSMIADWRQKTAVELVWLTAALTPSGPSSDNEKSPHRPDIRLAQQVGEGYHAPASGTAVGLDLGGRSKGDNKWMNNCVGYNHPPNKPEHSRRVALQVVHYAFGLDRVQSLLGGKDETTWTGPVLEQVEQTSNGKLLRFSPFSAQGLRLRDVKSLNGDGSANDCLRCCDDAPPFEVSVGDVWTAVSRHETVVDGSTIKLIGQAAVAANGVRYAYSDFVECVLDNDDGLPAGPFMRPFVSKAKASWTTMEAYQTKSKVLLQAAALLQTVKKL